MAKQTRQQQHELDEALQALNFSMSARPFRADDYQSIPDGLRQRIIECAETALALEQELRALLPARDDDYQMEQHFRRAMGGML